MRKSRSLRALSMAVVIALPLLGVWGVATAAKVKAAKGCHKTHSCKKSGGGSGSGTGGPGSPPEVSVQVDPNPLVETGPSLVTAVIQVEMAPIFAGDPVTISSQQLVNACGGIVGFLNNETAGLN